MKDFSFTFFQILCINRSYLLQIHFYRVSNETCIINLPIFLGFEWFSLLNHALEGQIKYQKIPYLIPTANSKIWNKYLKFCQKSFNKTRIYMANAYFYIYDLVGITKYVFFQCINRSNNSKLTVLSENPFSLKLTNEFFEFSDWYFASKE